MPKPWSMFVMIATGISKHASKSLYVFSILCPWVFHVLCQSVVSALFGAGYNSSPGQNLVKVELSKIAATIVQDYEIRQLDERQEWSWKADFTVVPHSWLVFVRKRERE
ncbi:putative Cytochrome P450 [Seiridium cardinale]